CAQGQIAPGYPPNHSVVPTGVIPSARSASCSVRPTVTIRSGGASIVVLPYLCAIVTGKASASGAAAGSVGAAAGSVGTAVGAAAGALVGATAAGAPPHAASTTSRTSR